MLNLSLIELKAVAKIRDIKGYESMSEDELLSALKASKSEKNFDKTRIEQIKKNGSRHKFSKSKINKIRNFYEIENRKIFSVPKSF